MSYNIKGIPLPWVRHSDRYKNIAMAIKEMRQKGLGPDILALQEAFMERCDVVFAENAFSHRSKGPAKSLININSGIELLSDHEIIHDRHFKYSKSSGTDSFANKGVQFARIKIEGLPICIDFYNTHMNAYDSGQEARLHQICEMAEFIEHTHDKKNILMVTGDFNFDSTHPEYTLWCDLTQTINAHFHCAQLPNITGEKNLVESFKNILDHHFYSVPTHPESPFVVKIMPIHFERLFKDSCEGDLWSDHDAVLIHYKISWERR